MRVFAVMGEGALKVPGPNFQNSVFCNSVSFEESSLQRYKF